MKFKVGDRVRVYGWVQMFHAPYTPRGGGDGTIAWVFADGKEFNVEFDSAANGVRGGDKVHYSVSPKQCRRLRRRQKGVLVTREMLAKIWPRVYLQDKDTHSYYVVNGVVFKRFCKALGLESEDGK